MTGRIYVTEDRGWLDQTDWCGDFQPSLLGAPRTLEETSQKLTQSVQEKTAETLEVPTQEHTTSSKKKSFLERLRFSMFGK